jgi:hypothetical protein
MRETKLTFAVISFAVAVLVVLIGFGCGDTDVPTGGRTLTTPAGARVVRLSGPELDMETANNIDAQISRLNTVAKQVGLEKDPPKNYVFPQHSDYVIELVEAKGCEAPYGFVTEGPGYGTPTICVAGRYYPETNRIRTTVAAINQTRALQYEGEHFGLRLNDREEYLRTLNHLTGPPHPVLGRE